MGLEDTIPGYREALAREQSLRDSAFTGAPCTICGVEVPALTLRKLAILFQIRSPFFFGGERTAGDVGLFIWIASDRYSRDAGERTAFLEMLAALRGDWLKDIGEYLDYCFMDAPAIGARSRTRVTDTSFIAGFVDCFGFEYGWDDENTLTTPLPRLYQYLKEIGSRHNPKRAKVNPLSDRAKGAHLRARRAAKEKEAKP